MGYKVGDHFIDIEEGDKEYVLAGIPIPFDKNCVCLISLVFKLPEDDYDKKLAIVNSLLKKIKELGELIKKEETFKAGDVFRIIGSRDEEEEYTLCYSRSNEVILMSKSYLRWAEPVKVTEWPITYKTLKELAGDGYDIELIRRG
jgi:hypothetical protein